MSGSNEQGPTLSDDRIRQLEKRVERAEAEAAEWRERFQAAKVEADDLLGALVAASDDLLKLGRLSPRRFITAKRINRAIERHRQRRLSVSS
jgi:hypothetical protein